MSAKTKSSGLDRSSPVIFPSVSPKLHTPLTKKIPEANSWQEITVDYRYSPNLFGYEENALRIRERRHQSWNEDGLSEETPESHYRAVYLYEEEFMTENPIKPFLIQNSVDKRSGKYSANVKGSGFVGFSKGMLSKMKRTSVGI